MDDHKDAPIRPFGFDSRTALHCGVGSRRCKTVEKLWKAVENQIHTPCSVRQFPQADKGLTARRQEAGQKEEV